MRPVGTASQPAFKKLSILIPVYNEVHTIETLVRRVLDVALAVDREVLLCDDGSTDGTREILDRLRGLPGLDIEFLDENIGRGGVIKHLWRRVTGDIVIHQDADLEYDPGDYPQLIAPILSGAADVVYGSRFEGQIERMAWANNIGNKVMSAMARALYRIRITDLMTCYKVYRFSIVDGLRIDANGFHFEAELTGALAKRGARFAEVPISFRGRTVEEGKKIRARHALSVVYTLLATRLRAH